MTTRLDAEPETVRALARWLSAGEQQRADRYVLERDRRRFIVARARLRQLLAARLSTRPQLVELVYGEHGKPALAPQSGDTDWRFSVSHSDELAVFAFAREQEVGIDIEAIREIPDADAIVFGFFSPRERQAYLALGPEQKTLGFFNCWTRKEALLKALGRGLSAALDDFDVSLAPDEPAQILSLDDRPGSASGWCLDSFSPSPGFVAAVATRCPPAGAAGRIPAGGPVRDLGFALPALIDDPR
ncbi:MAG TPA: 4'-phosphopantetheinyl transferase superfamily protein [Burkholderiales bacterium]|nr:4'-phosphopantetheinyl transferase superfamily protein [Burkholderiales bacterium]